MERKDWTLLALAAAEGKALSPVQLQKSLFFLGKAYSKKVGRDFYRFKPYHYGPFDASIYRDVTELSREGLAIVVPEPEGRWNEYRATAAGIAAAQGRSSDAYPEAISYLARVVNWARSLSFQQLVRAVYAKFPEYREKSVFQD